MNLHNGDGFVPCSILQNISGKIGKSPINSARILHVFRKMILYSNESFRGMGEFVSIHSHSCMTCL